MGYAYLDHAADLAVRAWGSSLDEAFSEAAMALFSAMVRTERVVPNEAREVALSAPSLDLLLVDWLASLVALKDTAGLVFGRFEVRVAAGRTSSALAATAWGEPLDPARHEPGSEVKGISLLGLRVREEHGRWTAEYVADV